MLTPRLLVPAALLAAAAPAVPAASAEPAWQLSAKGSASAVVDLRRPVDLALTASSEAGKREVAANTVVRYAGSYGALVLRDAATRAPVYALFAVRGLPGAYPVDTSDVGDRQVLRPGRYVVELVGDGAVSVRLPVLGSPPRAVAATTRTEGVQAGTTRSTDASPLTRLRVPFTTTTGSPVLYLASTRVEGSVAGAHQACVLRPGGRACALDAEDGSAGVAYGVLQGRSGAVTWALRTTLPAGAHEAALDNPAVGTARDAVLFAVALPR